MTKYIGGINLLHILFITMFLFLFVSLNLYIKILRWQPKYTLLISLVSLIILGFWFEFKIAHSCDTWSDGINGSISGRVGQCTVMVPQICWYGLTDGMFDISHLIKNCHWSPQDGHYFNSYYNSGLREGPYLGFSDPKNLSEKEREVYSIYRTIFRKTKGFSTLE
jgi:hypothetical protein